jgi:hypothetical protein
MSLSTEIDRSEIDLPATDGGQAGSIGAAIAEMAMKPGGILPFPDGTSFRGVAAVLVVSLCALVIDTSLAGEAFTGGFTLPRALAGHVCLVALLAAWLISTLHRDEGIRIAALLLLTTAAMGPLGPFGTLVVLMISRLNQRSITPFERWYVSLFPETEREPARELYHRIVYGRHGEGSSSVAAFSDVISLGTVAQKQAALTLIADHFRPAYAGALRRALNDREAAVRVQGASAVARIENRFLERAMQLEAWVAGPSGGIEARLALARHLDDHANTGLLDVRRARKTRERALELFLACADERPDDPDLAKTCGRLLLRLDRSEEAARWLGQVVGRFAFAPQVFVWYLEALYRVGRLDDLRALCRAHGAPIKDTLEISDEMRNVIAMWMDPDAVA